MSVIFLDIQILICKLKQECNKINCLPKLGVEKTETIILSVPRKINMLLLWISVALPAEKYWLTTTSLLDEERTLKKATDYQILKDSRLEH